MIHFVYILKCINGQYYTGYTKNLKKRVQEHQTGVCISTKFKLPVVLIWYAAFPNQKIAVAFEKYLKTHSGKTFRNRHFLQAQNACTA